MRRFGVLLGLWGAGCTPASDVAGSWFSSLSFELPGQPAHRSLEDLAVLQDSRAVLMGPLVDGLQLVSSEPSVLRGLTAWELAQGGEVEEGTDPEATLFSDFENDRSGFILQAGEPGQARLSLVDPWTGEEVDAIEIEVEQASRMQVMPHSPWPAVSALQARVLADTEYQLTAVAFDQDGLPLLGRRDAECRLPPSPPGLHLLDCGAIEVVAPQDIVEIELMSVGEGAMLALGIDREGWPVVGLPAAWTGADKPEDRGDLYRFLEGAGGEPTEVVATFGSLQASAMIVQEGPGKVTRSDVHGCSTTGGAARMLPLLLVIPLLRRRALASRLAR